MTDDVATPTPGTPGPPTRTERLDELPFTRKHGRLLVGSGLGWALDALDVGLLSFVIAQLAVVWSSDKGALAFVASAGFAGMAIGAAVGGSLSDRLGRKTVFALTLLVYGLATGLSALSWSVGALLVLRFVVGLGLGAELPVASTLVSEFSPRRIRGRVVVLLEAFWALGSIAAALVGWLVIPLSDDGWRWALLIGALPALYAVFVRLRMPESVRFLEARGRHDEAERTVRAFEEAAGIARPAAAPRAAADTRPADTRPADPSRADARPADAPRASSAAALLRDGLRRRTVAIWVVWFMTNFSYYGAFVWLPTLLVEAGFPLVKSFEYTLLITLAQLPGYAASAWLIERWGRRGTLAVFLLGSAVAATAFGFGAVSGSATQIVVSGMFLSFFNLGAWGALYAVTPELYPTRLRGTGAGWAAGVGRIASIAAPLTVPPLLVLGGTPVLFAVFGGVFVVAAVAALALPELRGTRLAE
ncbi:MFS transporter [Frigoribacterium sp. VKM Ac-2530]|uniref:MFS transporter n=1 Tax=Frigoribacterium sp. VKM Ac-2530 TaxID=2783822 RepID=UPI00188C5524|nr:MFS transporter [Frigoribacterium sp. VKM Ac-2530]MBF4579118.1 MFS transporter [Frigoribacterium sp. VKM Ac-2530]